MATYTCSNRGRCAFADGRRKFTWTERGTPVCPGCGRRDTVSLASGFGLPGLGGAKWPLGIAGVAVAVFFMASQRNSPTAPVEKGGGGYRAETNARPGKAGGVNGEKAEAALAQATPPSNPRQPPAKSSAIANPELFGMIEIGGKGVKGIVVDLALTEREKGCQKDDEAFAECVRRSIRKPFEPRNVNPLDKAAIADTANAAKKIMDEMTAVYTVDPRQIYLVGSSSISNKNLVPHRDQLQEALEEALNKRGEMVFVTPEQEGELGFHGVLNLIPENWRAKRKQQTVVLDIGSGDTKGGYLEKYEGQENFVPVSVPWGTKSFTNAVDKQKGDAKFPEGAARLKINLLRPVIHDEVARKQGLINHTRVYLIGGIAWATFTLTQPGNTSPFPKMYPAHFDTLYNRAILDNAVYKLCEENPMRETNGDIKKACAAFTPDNLVAGLEILRTFSEEMHFDRKKVFFIRDSLYAWPLGYIIARCEEDNTCPSNNTAQ